jgi:hypothetical protein
MVSVLAIGPKVCGFTHSQGDGPLRVIKVHNTPYFGGKIKVFAPSHMILWHVKDLCEYERNIL